MAAGPISEIPRPSPVAPFAASTAMISIPTPRSIRATWAGCLRCRWHFWLQEWSCAALWGWCLWHEKWRRSRWGCRSRGAGHGRCWCSCCLLLSLPFTFGLRVGLCSHTLLFLPGNVFNRQRQVAFIQLIQKSLLPIKRNLDDSGPCEKLPVGFLSTNVFDIFGLAENMSPKHEAPHLGPLLLEPEGETIHTCRLL